MNVDKFLEHHGVLGMHWGRRNSRGTGVGATTKIPKKTPKEDTSSEDHKKKTNLKGKKIHEMSNTELKALNERLQLEKQYKELKKTDVSAGKKVAAEILSNVAKQTVTSFLVKNANLNTYWKVRKAMRF